METYNISSDIIGAIKEKIKALEDVCKYISEINTKIDIIQNSILESIRAINSPNIDPVLKENLIQNVKKWSEFGWVISRIPNDKIINSPQNIKTADTFMLNLITDEQIYIIFDELQTELKEYEQDIDDARFAYDNKRYKLFCTVLFPIIDSYFTRKFLSNKTYLQYDSIMELCNQYIDIDNERIFNNLRALNIVKILKKFFKPNNKSDKNCEMPYRNILLHGNSNRQYTKADCLKLLFLLEATTKLKYIKEQTPKIEVKFTPKNY